MGARGGFININDMYNNDVGKGGLNTHKHANTYTMLPPLHRYTQDTHEDQTHTHPTHVCTLSASGFS